MEKIGEYEYPTRTTFAETIQVADKAVNSYGGLIPYIQVTKILGYTISDPSSIPGYVYKRFDDMCMFKLLERDKPNRGLRATELGKRAVDPDYAKQANEAKAEAIRNIPIIPKAFTDWKGKIPEENAFPAKLVDLTSENIMEAKKYVVELRKLMLECFPYLESPGVIDRVAPRASTVVSPGRGERRLVDTPASISITAEGTDYGELRTTIGSVSITDKVTLELAKHLLEALGTRLEGKRKTILTKEEKE